MLVDEASMVDVKMGLALLEALPKGCRLVLVGQPLLWQSKPDPAPTPVKCMEISVSSDVAGNSLVGPEIAA